jgi:hypothetical protein
MLCYMSICSQSIQICARMCTEIIVNSKIKMYVSACVLFFFFNIQRVINS